MKQQNILAVDTSSRVLSVAIRSRAGELFESSLEGTPRHSEQLLELLEQGLKQLQIAKHEIDQLIWGLGPGSFTGLRIGLSVLKGLHLVWDRNALGASSLDLIALATNPVTGQLAVCVDARRGRLYVARYRFQAGEPEKLLPDSLLSFEELMAQMNHQTVLTGDALGTYGARIREHLGHRALLAPRCFWYPRASGALLLYESKPDWLEPLTLRSMTPRYLRLPEAVEKSKLAARRVR